MKTNIAFYTLLTLVFGLWLYVLNLFFGHVDIGIIIFAFFGMIITILIIAAVMEIIRRIKNGIDIFATLETDPEKVKSHMLFIMQWGHHEGIAGALNEFNDIFRNYPQWELQKWDVFKAWYKDLIDNAIGNPAIYTLIMKDGSPYNKAEDPLYDPEAPDWSQFDRKHYTEDDGGDYTDDNRRKSAEEGFYTGLGLGATDNYLNE